MSVMDASHPIRIRLAAAAEEIPTWEERINDVPQPGHIRLLDPPVENDPLLSFLWSRDMTLTEWANKIERCQRDVSENPIASALRPADHLERLTAIFAGNQRQRWLARIALQRWTQRVWRKRTQCNIDMIDMQPIPDADAIFLTDTKHRMIYRFHRNDVFKNLLTNICLSDEMLPTPRYPTNPWTNAKLTMAQTIGICQHIAVDYGRRGRSPPVLFAAFWAARFSLKRFMTENSGLLAQHAVTSFFKDLHEHNEGIVLDTITTLLTSANLDFSLLAIRRWLRQSPQTPLHREWLEFARDYTLYINLHVQIRPHWYTEDLIYRDVRNLYGRTVLPDTTSQRMQLLRNPIAALNFIPAPLPDYGMLGLPMILHMNDPSGATMTQELAIQLIQDALFRLP